MRVTNGLLIALAVAPALAAPGEVQNLRWSSKTVMDWDNVSGAAAYHLYGGDLTGLPGNATWTATGLTMAITTMWLSKCRMYPNSTTGRCRSFNRVEARWLAITSSKYAGRATPLTDR